jgi:hypothetical protein
MGLWKSFECLKCKHEWEGMLDVCSKCGSRAVPVGGIRGCLESGRPPGYAGGTSTPHSARSYDRCFEQNFRIMGISNLYHKDGVPVVTRNRSPKMRYNTMPDWAGQQQPIKAYSSQEAMRRDGVQLPPMTIEGKPFQPPQVHPTVQPGARVGQGLSQTMRANTIITHRHQE